MPVPTSLIIVVLVVAWLAVLVPMVARRREKVPEWDEGGSRFRVLARTSTVRRRPGLGLLQRKENEMNAAEDVDEFDEMDGPAEPLDEELLDAPAGAGSERDGSEGSYNSDDSYSDDSYYSDEAGEADRAPRRRGLRRSGSAPLSAPEPRVLPEAVDDTDQIDEQRYRPVPQRHGRGGYDPEAAEATRHYRYQRRRRITAVLALLTLVFVVAAILLARSLWIGAVVCGLLLVGYLAYLRRQVRIEEDIRQRRLAKLRRARQIRPEYAFEPADYAPVHSGYSPSRSGASPVHGGSPVHRGLPVHSGAAPMAPAAAAAWNGPGRGRVMVDLDDDDPAFDDLEFYEPVAFQRASGQ